jgi:hypothetical protein
MRKVFNSVFIAVVVTLIASTALSAKSPTSKITIMGPVLREVLEVTDLKALDKWNVWGGGFISRSNGIVSEPPTAIGSSYEVSFYITLQNDQLKKVYVVFYYPDPDTQGGYIYLPGEADKQYRLNTTAILRDGYDGNWLRATESWNQFIRPLLDQAKAFR